MLNLIRNTDSTIHVPITIDPDADYTIKLKSKLSCREYTLSNQQGDMCGTVALFVLNTEAECGEYWLTVSDEDDVELVKKTVVIQ